MGAQVILIPDEGTRATGKIAQVGAAQVAKIHAARIVGAVRRDIDVVFQVAIRRDGLGAAAGQKIVVSDAIAVGQVR